ncbi:MAG: hypothetical protein ACPG7F_01790 [Aggregatilineales bacterium]
MPLYNPVWIVEDKVVLGVSEGQITIDELSRFSQQVEKLLNNTSSERVHCIISEEKMTSLPKSLKDFRKATQFLFHKKLGWFLIYGNMDRERLAITLATFALRIAQVKHRRFETLEECLEFVAALDIDIPDAESMLEAAKPHL